MEDTCTPLPATPFFAVSSGRRAARFCHMPDFPGLRCLVAHANTELLPAGRASHLLIFFIGTRLLYITPISNADCTAHLCRLRTRC